MKLDRLTKQLLRRVEWQRVPMDIGEDELSEMIVDAIKSLYVLTGRWNALGEQDIVYDEKGVAIEFKQELKLDEEIFVLLHAERSFYKKVASALTDAIGYTTDALSITGADKGYKNIREIVDKLDNEIRVLYYKMARYTI